MVVTVRAGKDRSRIFDQSMGRHGTYTMHLLPYLEYRIHDDETGADITIPGEVLMAMADYARDDLEDAYSDIEEDEERCTTTRPSTSSAWTRSSGSL